MLQSLTIPRTQVMYLLILYLQPQPQLPALLRPEAVSDAKAF